jgi:hypothetical protein
MFLNHHHTQQHQPQAPHNAGAMIWPPGGDAASGCFDGGGGFGGGWASGAGAWLSPGPPQAAPAQHHHRAPAQPQQQPHHPAFAPPQPAPPPPALAAPAVSSLFGSGDAAAAPNIPVGEIVALIKLVLEILAKVPFDKMFPPRSQAERAVLSLLKVDGVPVILVLDVLETIGRATATPLLSPPRAPLPATPRAPPPTPRGHQGPAADTRLREFLADAAAASGSSDRTHHHHLAPPRSSTPEIVRHDTLFRWAPAAAPATPTTSPRASSLPPPRSFRADDDGACDDPGIHHFPELAHNRAHGGDFDHDFRRARSATTGGGGGLYH